MIVNVYTIPRKQSHKKIVAYEIERLKQKGFFIVEARRVVNSWWGILADDDYTQIVYRKKDEL